MCVINHDWLYYPPVARKVVSIYGGVSTRSSNCMQKHRYVTEQSIGMLDQPEHYRVTAVNYMDFRSFCAYHDQLNHSTRKTVELNVFKVTTEILLIYHDTSRRVVMVHQELGTIRKSKIVDCKLIVQPKIQLKSGMQQMCTESSKGVEGNVERYMLSVLFPECTVNKRMIGYYMDILAFIPVIIKVHPASLHTLHVTP